MDFLVVPVGIEPTSSESESEILSIEIRNHCPSYNFLCRMDRPAELLNSITPVPNNVRVGMKYGIRIRMCAKIEKG
jgi:hypothetical protein